MPISTPTADRPMRSVLIATAAWTMGGVVLFLVAPLTALVLLLLCIVAPVGWYWAVKGRLPWHRPSAVFVSLYLATVYLAINVTWSLDPTRSAVAVVMLLAFVSAVDVTLSTLEENDQSVVKAMSVGFLAGLIIGGAFLCFEIFSGQWIRRTIMAVQPWAQPGVSFMRLGPNGVTLLPDLLNRNMTALTLLLWPAVLVINGLGITRNQRAQLLLALIPASAAILCSGHATSRMALVGGAVIYGLCLVRPAFARWTTIAGWITATLVIVPLAMVLFSQKIYTSPWLFPSAQQRIVIWGYTSEQVAKAPIFGAGINAARVLDARDWSQAPRAPGTQFRLGTGWHAHNVYLQAWYEAGAIGAAFMLGIGLLVIRSLADAPSGAQSILLATFVSCALIGASSFSLWAPWFMASFGLAAIFAGLGTGLARWREAP